MSMKQHFQLLAKYNQRMNAQVFAAASQLSDADLARDNGAFFSSILGTLNHLVVGDTIWLKRFATHQSCSACLQEVADLAQPSGLAQIIFEDFNALREHRQWLDEIITNWIDKLREDDLNSVLRYKNTKGVVASKRYSNLILHFFNHQTHHRGQVSTLLFQMGVDVGITDLVALIADEQID